MPCFHPTTGWRTPTNKLVFGTRARKTWAYVPIPCGYCTGCRTAKAQGWALRCILEQQQHSTSVFTTLTLDDARNTGELDRQAYSLWIKRLRDHLRRKSNVAIRHFGCGEYGETTHRPHYHAILFGIDASAADLIEHTWGHGLCHTVPANRKCIAYTAGYVAKKLEMDPDRSGRLAPFIQMSRRPGIGGHARKHWQSWRDYGIDNGTKVPVPRFLHEAWKNQASFGENDKLQAERAAFYLTREPINLTAAELIAEARRHQNSENRKL